MVVISRALPSLNDIPAARWPASAATAWRRARRPHAEAGDEEKQLHQNMATPEPLWSILSPS